MKAQEIKKHLDRLFPFAECELHYNSPYELLVATILSAQCTDKRVNKVTEELFKRASTPYEMVKLSQEELENIIHSCGFYHNKATNILKMSKELVEKYNGQVPGSLEEMQTLAGVGRKTANVVYSEGFKGDAFAVDTHVLRVSNRLGLADTQDPTKCELALTKFFPKKDWSELHLQMVHFGRYKCKSQKPDCKECPFERICKFNKEEK